MTHAEIRVVPLQEDVPQFVTREPRLQKEIAEAKLFSEAGLAVCLLGESGVGKSLLARDLHAAAARSGELVTVDCPSVPESLFEAELFGHIKGSFTGASGSRVGHVALANNGSLFLDEIGDLSRAMQVKLLRVIQERRFRRVGESVESEVDVQWISATNADISKLLSHGDFRLDLFHRLVEHQLFIPSLRERPLDIFLLVEHCLAELDCSSTRLSPTAWTALREYPWPGNVRELRYVLRRGVILSRGAQLQEEHLRLSAVEGSAEQSGCAIVVGDTISEANKKLMRATLEHTQGNVQRAATLLGITPGTLYRHKRAMRATQ